MNVKGKSIFFTVLQNDGTFVTFLALQTDIDIPGTT